MGYVKKNFLAGLELAEFSALAPAAQAWVDTVADVRVHAATHQRPIDRFEDERHKLKRLNPAGFDLGTISTVRAASTCRVPLESNQYSVPPHLAGQRLERVVGPPGCRSRPIRTGCASTTTSSSSRVMRAAWTATATSRIPTMPACCRRSVRPRASSA